MKTLDDIIFGLYKLPQNKFDEEGLRLLKRKYCKENKLAKLPTNIQLLKLYRQLLDENKIEKNEDIERILRKRGIRSMSGIVPIQVLMKPNTCPGQCIFCPNDASMPKSYINTEPGAMRALLNEFDPIKQVYNRLLSLNITGHNTDKIEMIVLGGSFDAYSKEYKMDFITKLYEACNTFPDYQKNVEVDMDNPMAAKYTMLTDNQIEYEGDLSKAQMINEIAKNKIIGLTIETRPEYVTDKNCQFWRELGVTRIEMGIQSLFDEVLEANKRGHTVEDVRKAMDKLKRYGFKISTHFMPGLYKSDVEMDVQTMHKAYSDPFIKPDEIKFYPTSVIPNTELYELFVKGEYTPLEQSDIEHIIEEVKINHIPPYTRIKRLIRDIPADEIAAGSKVTNLRQLVVNRMKKEFELDEGKRVSQYSRLYQSLQSFEKVDDMYEYMVSNPFKGDGFETLIVGTPKTKDVRNFQCLCTRCREIRNSGSKLLKQENVVVRRYLSSVGVEYFITIEDDLGYLGGFVRLLLPNDDYSNDYEGLGENVGLVRELHVYGEVAKIDNNKDKSKVQHKGLGSRLMMIAEDISKRFNYEKVSVISGVGVRGFYKKIGYDLEGTYMVKYLKK